jgi:S-adenosylmethionine hydrolase
VRLKIPGITWVRDSMIQGGVLAVDHFGNLITNLKPEDVPAYKTPPGKCKLLAAQREITAFHRTFADGPAGELFVIPGSTGYLEIVVRQGSAASALNLKPGAPVGLVTN